MTKHAIPGSERAPLDGARSVGQADPAERLNVTVIVRRRDPGAFSAKLAEGGRVERADYADQFGADPVDLAAVKAFAAGCGLTVVEEHPSRRTLILSGTVAAFNAAFDVELETFEHPGGRYRGRTGPLHVPSNLSGIVEAVLGLDNRPQTKPHFRLRASAATSYTPLQIAELYGFPASNGAGQTIGLIELGGGYSTADLATYFAELGLTAPKITAVAVDGGENQPTGDANGPDGEVMLDIEVAGAIAPSAEIVVYFAPNTDAGFLDAVTTAIHDETNRPSVISISWGGPESSWTAQATSAFDQAFQSAAALGVTICVASGDNGSSDGASGGGNQVDFPASSPHALGCGGTSLRASGTDIMSEKVWNDGASGGAGGGGVSTVFALPSWQNGLVVTEGKAQSALKMRGVPDVAGDADPETGYKVRVDGGDTVIGGTSAVAPLWAGLIARINATTGKSVGYLNPLIYPDPAGFNDISQGDNGTYHAAKGWDACTGLGSPRGQALLLLLSGKQKAKDHPIAP